MEKTTETFLPATFESLFKFTQRLSLTSADKAHVSHSSCENFPLVVGDTNGAAAAAKDAKNAKKITKSSSNINISNKDKEHEQGILFKSYAGNAPKTTVTSTGQVKLVSPYGDWCAFRLVSNSRCSLPQLNNYYFRS